MATINDNKPASLLTHEKALELAKTLNAGADGWVYEATPTGPESKYSKVIVYDEDGEEIGPL